MRRHITDDELVLSLDGELSPRRQLRVAQHLVACRECRERVDLMRSTLTEVDAFYRDEFAGPSQPSDHGRARLVAALCEVPSAQPWFQRASARVTAVAGSPRVGVGVVVMALCVAALIAVRAATESGAGGLPSGALPESSLTPGAVSQLTTAELCNGVRPSRLVMERVREQVVRSYGMEHLPATAYELDALITPELGGSTHPANLWPQRYHAPVWNARVKDELELLLPEMVCRGEITLAQAQRDIASDWIGAYKRHFKTDAPLRAHRGPAPDDDEELLIVPDEPTTQVATIRLASR